MWQVVTFKTAEARDKWIERHGAHYQYREVFIEQKPNAPKSAPRYALDVRKLRIIY